MSDSPEGLALLALLKRPIGYDRLYQPMTMLDHLDKFQSEAQFDAYLRIAESYVAGWRISTVWTGGLQAISADVPEIYETMIFEPDEPDDEDEVVPELVKLIGHLQVRWSWEPDAREGHACCIGVVFATMAFCMVLHGSPVYVPALPAPAQTMQTVRANVTPDATSIPCARDREA